MTALVSPLQSPLRSPLHKPQESKWGETLDSFLASAGSDLLIFMDATDLCYQEPAATTEAGSGDPVGFIFNKSQFGGKRAAEYMSDNAISDPTLAPGDHFTEATNKPTLSSANSLTFNGSSHLLQSQIDMTGADFSDVSVYCVMQSTDVIGVTLSDIGNPSSRIAFMLQSGGALEISASVGAGTSHYVDTVSKSTRDEFYQAVTGAQYRVVEGRGFDLNTWDRLNMGYYSPVGAWSFGGQIRYFIIIKTGAWLTGNRGQLEAFLTP